MRQVILILILLMIPAVWVQSAATNAEIRAIWIDANTIPTNDKDMEAFVARLADMNLNVLFPESIRRGYTIYPSKLDTQDPRFKSYDPLASMIREARKHKIEVHPWVWVFRQGYSLDKGPIFKAHPEWMAMNKWGDTLSANNGYWICPSIPEARDYLISLFKELATNYDIDGLHLDYIRFENQFPSPYCYNDSCRHKFKAVSGVDPIHIDPLTEKQVEWHLWREDLVNTFVERVQKEIRLAKPKALISAAVGTLPDQARVSLLQNWTHWVNNRWVDFLVPMAYTSDTEKFRQMVIPELAATKNKTFVVPGIGLHTMKTPEAAVAQVQAARDLNADGIAIFASVYLTDAFAKALKDNSFKDTALVTPRSPKDSIAALIEGARASLKNGDPAKAAEYFGHGANVAGYMAYQAGNREYVAATRPPLVIPASPLLVPGIAVSKTTTAPGIDGRLDDAIWEKSAVINIAHTEMGNSAPVQTYVKIAYDDTNLYIAYCASESAMSKLKATVTKQDGPTFYDDSAEIFLDPMANGRSYFQLAANTLGTRFDAKVNDVAVNPEWTASAITGSDGWTMKIAIPFKSLGATTPKPGTRWKANFARNRWVTGSPEYLAWSVPYGSFHRPERFGTILFK